VPRAWSRRNLVHADPLRNRAETLMVGSGAGVARLYDKHRETEGRAPVGTVRFEAECRPGWCEKYGEIRRLSDVTTEKVSALARNRWDWSAMGTEVVSSGVVLLKRLDDAGLSPAKKRGFIGWLVEQSVGIPSPIGTETHAEYRRIQRDLGIVASEVFGGAGGLQVMSRLDFDEGTELLRVA
jgi:hypothetical protein